MKKPSDFARIQAWDSVFQDADKESIALIILCYF